MKRNRIKCKRCGDIIESKYRHDFKWCKCKTVFVDGGLDYRRVGGNLEDIEVIDEQGGQMDDEPKSE